MADLGAVTIDCPKCGDHVSVPIRAQVAEPTDAGVVYVDVTADKVEIELQTLTCTATTT